jgi:hypothetical protein
MKKAKLIPDGLFFYLFTLLTDKLKIILPITSVIIPTNRDSVNSFIIINN